MFSRASSRPEAAGYVVRAGRLLPKFPVYFGIFFPIFVSLALLAPVGSVFAQGNPTAPEKPAAAEPAAPAQQPATATTPAVPVPGAQTPASKPGDPAPSAAKDPAAPPAPPAPTSEAASAPQAGPAKTVTGTGSSLIPHDLSPYGMFMNADVVVKVVMVGLAFASLVTWTILLVKFLELVGARARAKQALDQLAGAGTLGEAVAQLKSPKAPVTRLAQAALSETERSTGLPGEGVKERAAALLSRIEARTGRAMQRGTGLLATIGSTAPFVGLFGTVWGIMNSFIGISKTNTTNLAVVAPGIAEALLATAFGLVAAIPAVIIYNMFARSITGYRAILGDASTEVLRLLSRDLDRAQGAGRVPTRQAAE